MKHMLALLPQRSNDAEAMTRYQTAVEQNPDDVDSLAHLALSLVYTKNYDRALLTANQALKINKNSDYAHMVLAILHHIKGEIGQFVDELEETFSLKPFVFDVAYTYAGLLAKEKDIYGAIPVLEEMIRADAAKQCRNYLYGLAYYQLKQPRLAIRHSLIALKTDPSLKTFAILAKSVLNASLPLTFFVSLLFFFGLAGLIWYGNTLSFFLLALLIGTYVMGWFFAGVWLFSRLGLIINKSKRSKILVGLTVLDLTVFLIVLAHLIF